MDILKPRWTSATFLLYAGGFTVSTAASYSLSYLGASYGDAAFAAWALLIVAVLLAIAIVWQRRGSALAAGVFAVVAVGAFGGFLGALWRWFGWSDGGNSPFGGFHLGRFALDLLILAFAISMIRRFRHPLLALPIAAVSWFFVTDLISNGGSWSAIVSAFVGFVLLLVAVTLDRGTRRPYGFWVHVVAGLALGGALLYWWHAGDWHWALIVLGSLAYVRVAAATGRSSWAVLGAIGLLLAAGHFTLEWWHRSLPFFGEDAGTPRAWVPPVIMAILGFVYVALAMLVSRRERR